MIWFAQAVLWGWLPLVLILFLVMPARRAVVVALITSWLLLPQLGFQIDRVPDYTKMSATCYAIIIGALLLDPKQRILGFRPIWLDLPVLLYCLHPFVPSMLNDKGFYDGASVFLERFVQFGLPYLIGRLYFQTPAQARDLCLGIIIGGLVYVPLVLYEVRMSPQLHRMIYGISPINDWQQAVRWGGWRPIVFMSHGLATGLWMATAAALAAWLWHTKSTKRVVGLPLPVVGLLLLITAVLCKSTGAVLLLGALLGVMLSVKYLNTKALVWVVAAAIPAYLILRSTGLFEGAEAVRSLGQAFPWAQERTDSLLYRMVMENAIVGRTMEKPLFGWAGWGDAFNVRIEEFQSMAVPDSFWIRTFGEGGYTNLVLLYGIYLAPLFLLLTKLRPRDWRSPAVAPLTGLAMIVLVYAMDALFNSMLNPIYIVAIGAVSGMAAAVRRVPAGQRSAAPAGRKMSPAITLDDEDPLLGDSDDLLIDLEGTSAGLDNLDDDEEPLVLIDTPRFGSQDRATRGGPR